LITEWGKSLGINTVYSRFPGENLNSNNPPSQNDYRKCIQDLDILLTEQRVKTSGDSFFSVIIAGVDPISKKIKLGEYSEKMNPKRSCSYITSLPLQAGQSKELHQILSLRIIKTKKRDIRRVVVKMIDLVDLVYIKANLMLRLIKKDKKHITKQEISLRKNKFYIRVKEIVSRALKLKLV
jgi:hypothetical protein